jgi:hypothetical protein
LEGHDLDSGVFDISDNAVQFLRRERVFISALWQHIMEFEHQPFFLSDRSMYPAIYLFSGRSFTDENVTKIKFVRTCVVETEIAASGSPEPCTTH